MPRKLLIIPAAVAAIAISIVITISGPTGASAGGTAVYDFGGSPSAPGQFTQLNQSAIDVQKHSRSPETWYAMEPMHAQHGPACEAPTMTHVVTNWDDTVFQCKDHVMTALNTSDYGVIYLTPNAMVDFSGGTAVIQWEMSTDRQSVRDWPDVWISPYATNRALPLDQSLPDLQGPPPNAIHVSFNTSESAPVLTVIKNGRESDFNAGWNTPSMRSDIAPGTNQAQVRQTFKLSVSKTRVKLERVASSTATAVQFFDFAVPDVGFDKGVVQFGHHSYTPTKDNSGDPGTWHWDNISISPSIPLTFIKTDKAYLDGRGGTVAFASPAPNNAFLRFAAIGRVTVNGTTVQPVDSGEFAEHFSSYFVPIPQGTKSVNIGLTDAAYPAFARDFAVWSQGASGGGTVVVPTSTASPVASATGTATTTSSPTSPATPSATSTRTASPTATATATVSATPSPTRTASATTTAPATATSTPSPTATSTPSPAPSPAAAGSRIQWEGKDWYVLGANLPWYNWAADFGGGSRNGVSSAASRTAIGNKLKLANGSGINTIRWWMFPGEPWQITTDRSGRPTGLHPDVYKDIDAALALADQSNVYYNFVLFSAPSHLPSSWLTNASHRQALADLLGQLAGRYKSNKRILSWEIVNEPEWDIWNGAASQGDVQDLVRRSAAALNAASPAHVTVGAAMIDGIELWRGLGLDFYQAHWYDYMASGDWCARCTNYQAIQQRLNLDAPVVIGEFYAAGGGDALARFKDLYAKGYAGAWVWSLFSDRTSDKMTIDLAAAKAFADQVSDEGPKAGASSSGSSPTSIASATATRTPTATPTTRTRRRGFSSLIFNPIAEIIDSIAPAPTSTPSPTPTSSSGSRRRSQALEAPGEQHLIQWSIAGDPVLECNLYPEPV